jgi:hypothetical protein
MTWRRPGDGCRSSHLPKRSECFRRRERIEIAVGRKPAQGALMSDHALVANPEYCNAREDQPKRLAGLAEEFSEHLIVLTPSGSNPIHLGIRTRPPVGIGPFYKTPSQAAHRRPESMRNVKAHLRGRPVSPLPLVSRQPAGHVKCSEWLAVAKKAETVSLNGPYCVPLPQVAAHGGKQYEQPPKYQDRGKNGVPLYAQHEVNPHQDQDDAQAAQHHTIDA